MTMKIGVTGHRQLFDDSWVKEAITASLSEVPSSCMGISSLAIGADQLFAEIVLHQGGTLHVVLPFEDYERTFDAGASRDRYFELLRCATSVETLSARENDEESYLAAGQHIVDLADRMIAVWDGEKAAGLGGTGDIVQYARAARKEVLHIDPVLRKVRVLPKKGP